MLSVLLRYTDSDYPFGIFKLFLYLNRADVDQLSALKGIYSFNKHKAAVFMGKTNVFFVVNVNVILYLLALMSGEFIWVIF